MPRSERAATLIAGAVLGVIVILGTLFGVVWAVEDHFVTRTEYTQALAGIHADLAEIKHQGEVMSEKLEKHRAESKGK
jgi:hypothetical protein